MVKQSNATARSEDFAGNFARPGDTRLGRVAIYWKRNNIRAELYLSLLEKLFRRCTIAHAPIAEG